MTHLAPDDGAPNAPTSPTVLARRLGMRRCVLDDAIAAGLPTCDGRIDPFAACAWLMQHRPSASPVLARRWAMFRRHVERHLSGTVRARRLRIARRHALHLPHAAAVRWWLPRLLPAPGQPQAEERPAASPLPGHWQCDCATVQMTHVLAWPAAVALAPERTGRGDDLLPLVEELAATFRYAYRRHAPWAEPHRSEDGSCLDISLELGARLSARGRPWRLCVGVWARTGLATPHVWLEVADADSTWTPVDPSLPAIGRLLGADWRTWARAWTGSHDGLRITVARGDLSLARIPGGATLHSLVGEAVIADGANAWACCDWACGECSWTIG